jgi:hypothetical protein
MGQVLQNNISVARLFSINEGNAMKTALEAVRRAH